MTATAKKTIAVFLSLLLAFAMTPAIAWADAASTLQAAEIETVDISPQSDETTVTEGWNPIGTCEWRIDEAKRLTLRPANNGMEGFVEKEERSFPWRPYNNNRIRSFSIVGKVRLQGDCSKMFYCCDSLAGLSNLDTSEVTDMNNMFRGCKSLVSLDLSSFDTSKVTDMSEMFCGCESLVSLDLSSFDTSKVTDMSEMFSGCNSLASLDLSSFDTSDVTDMSGMFYGGAANKLTANTHTSGPQFESLDLSSFDTSKVTNMACMFAGCNKLKHLDLSSFNTRNVTKMYTMFANCESLEQIDLSSFNTANVTNMACMFHMCRSLKSIDLSNFNTSKVVEMSSMFAFCTSLESLDLKSFDTSNVINMGAQNGIIILWPGMFYGCKSLTTVDLSSFDTSNVINFSSMFGECPSLLKLDVSSFDTRKSGLENADRKYGLDAICNSIDLSPFDNSLEEIAIGSNFTLNNDLPAAVWADSEGREFDKASIPRGIAGTYHRTDHVSPAIRDLSQGTLVIASSKLTYNGKAQLPSVTVSWGDSTLVPGRDYRLSYRNNVNAGTASVAAQGIGAYSGQITRNFSIAPAKITSAQLKATSFKYTGKALRPGVKVVKAGGIQVPTSGYTVKYLNNTKVGRGVVVVTGRGSYTGTVRLAFTIKAAKGQTFTSKGVKYKVSKTNAEVAAVGTTKRTGSVSVPSTVKLGGKAMKVTAIGDKAFYKKGVTKVTVGANVKKVGKQAFAGCKKLKTLKISSKKVSSFGKSMVKGAYSKLKVQVPKSKLKTYSAKVKRTGGFKKTMRVVRA